jgi:hypothetical protein
MANLKKKNYVLHLGHDTKFHPYEKCVLGFIETWWQDAMVTVNPEINLL